jgi:DNA polymerase-3 subunit epsilon
MEPIGLSDMARTLGLPVHRPHHAQGDALTTAQSFVALATHLERFGSQTLGALKRASSEPGRRPWFRSVLDRLGVRPRERG